MLQWISNKYTAFESLSPSLRTLIVNSTIVAFGSFMVTPFLAIFLKFNLGLENQFVGILVAISTMIQFGGGIVGAMFAERIGLKHAMVFSLGLRSFGFVFLALSPTYNVLILPSIILVATGSAIYLPANRAYIVSSVAAELRPIFISISNSALSAGMAAGPLVAGIFMDQSATHLFYSVALLFFLLTIVHQYSLKQESKAPKRSSFKGLPTAFLQVQKPAVFSIITYYIYFFFKVLWGYT